MHHYALVIEPLSDEDGGGFWAFYPDLPGCVSDGDTVEEAVANAADALAAWLAVAKEDGREVPAPGAARLEVEEEYKAMTEALEQLGEDLKAARARITALERGSRTKRFRPMRHGSFVAA